jgi:hydrogenase maturation factor
VNEIAEAAGVRMRIEEAAVPVRPAVAGACEALGLDPLAVANEGKFVVVAAADEAEAALAAMRSHPLGREAAIIGEVLAGRLASGISDLKSQIPGGRPLTANGISDLKSQIPGGRPLTADTREQMPDTREQRPDARGAASRGPLVTLRTRIGGERVLELPYGEQLPRIC